MYDFSDYKKDHFLYSDVNKKVIGKFKDETHGVPIREFVGLRSKMYAFSLFDEKKQKTIETKKLKGVKQHVVKKELKFADYYRSLMGEENSTFNRWPHSIVSGQSIKQLSCAGGNFQVFWEFWRPSSSCVHPEVRVRSLWCGLCLFDLGTQVGAQSPIPWLVW